MNVLRTAAIVLALGAVKVWAGAEDGKEVFAKSCKTCHGADGQSNPTIAKMMKVEFKALGSAEVQSLSDFEFERCGRQRERQDEAGERCERQAER